ncbi:SRPBCC domain-containing protein [Ruegeria arenilitoris]|uniref:SRPBCC domain-containing protein n=1 Tax=Ruegeria arenilitoris TaxID=1173585 RepID=UPI00147A9657|nr:SRPBCC domain-containing protein [Ruegeria arenilitoris]
MTDPIVKAVTVSATPVRAFEVFVNHIAKWWPLDKHAVSAADGKPALAVTIEPKVGGAIFETKWDGERADWGRVLEFEPGHRLAFSWHPGTDRTKPTRVEVVFEEDASGCSLITLTHSGWEIWATEAPDKMDGYNSGWDFVFGERYANAVQR